MLAELHTPQGVFASALDADSLDTDGRLREGAFYAWTPDEVGARVAELCDVTERGTFEHGRSVLQLRDGPPEWWAAERARLHGDRADRPPPARDDKVVTGWNGLAIAALADAGSLLSEPGWVVHAATAAEFLLARHWSGGRLIRTSRDGVAGRSAGVLEDYGGLAEGLLALHCATGEERWLTAAGELLAVVLDQFGDGEGGFYDTAADAERLISRPSDPTDGATPSGASLAAGALLSYAALTGSTTHRDAAEAALRRLNGLLSRHPRFAGWWLAVAEASRSGPVEVRVVDRPDLLAVARRTPSPGALVVAAGTADLTRPGAYVCRDRVCLAAITTAGALAAELGVTTVG